MKIGIQTNLLDEKGYGRWHDNMYTKLKEHGYSCTDYNMSDTESIIYTAEREESDAFLMHEKELADKAGIEIVQVHGPWCWPSKDFTDEDRAERMEKMKKSIRATSLLGCKNWVIHPIMPYGTEDINTENASKTWDMNIAFMSELLKNAKEYDVTICLENMPMHDFSISKPKDILKFVKTINDKNFKICLDTGHISVFDELNAADEVRRLGNEIQVLHVHDNDYNADMHLMPCFGCIDWGEFASALKDIGFNGCFSLETMPPRQLSDALFEDLCKLLPQIATKILDNSK